MTPEQFVERAIGVPFLDHGRNWDGWDCWGLVRTYYDEVLKINLPSHDAGYVTAGDNAQDREVIQDMIDSARPMWKPSSPEAGDVLLMRISGRPVHVGVIVDSGRFLHTEKRIGTVIERMASPMWARRIEGVYRYAAH